MDPAALRDLHRRHLARVRRLDPLLPRDLPSPDPADGEQVLAGEHGDAVAAGTTRTTRHALDDPAVLWGAARQHVLQVRADGPEAHQPHAWDRLLDAWDPVLHERATPGDRDEAALVRTPARDDAGARALALHGFAPLLVTAVRRAGAPLPPPTNAVRVTPLRDAREGDVLAAAVALHAWDARYGAVTPRANAEQLAQSLVDAAYRLPPDLALVALDDDGALTGLVTVDPPSDDSWFGASTSGRSGYLGMLWVEPGRRGAGTGAALVDAALTAAEGPGGAEVVLLDHALPSAWSTPFWHRAGFRPLWTTWQRRPVLR